MKKWLAPSFVLMLALLVAGELVVRIGFKRSMTGRFDYGYDPNAGFVENSNGTVSLTRTGGRHFFPQTFSRVRPPDAYRIMVFGDSVPRGGSVATCYATQVADKLSAQGIKAEGINFCIGGNGALRTQIILRKGLQYQPSLVILHADNSDEYDDEREYKRAQNFKSWAPQYWLTKSYLIRRIYEFTTEQIYWAWLPNAIRDLNSVNDDDIKKQDGENSQQRQEWNQRFVKYTTESVQLARSYGVPVLLVSEARLRYDSNNQPYLDDLGVDNYLQPLLGPGVYFLSMKQVLKNTDYVPLFSDGTHLHPPGHAFLADEIIKKLREEKLVPLPMRIFPNPINGERHAGW
ncbi:MAG: hypothetical protein LV481_04290 [Methylacidiphilales bacterium]|nr:hypothetical protein [Candidatus Methylacidiphilales bacterium]